MNDLVSMLKMEHHFNDLMRQAEMASAYRVATASLGPSQQLINFIDHDNTLHSEIGLETFGKLSTEAQHEILLSMLKPEDLEFAALESLSERIHKIAHSVESAGIGGVIGAIINRAILPSQVHAFNFKLGLISGGVILAGHIVKKVTTNIAGVYPAQAFHKVEKMVSQFIQEESLFAEQMPTTLDLGQWGNFYTKVFGRHSEQREEWNKSFDKLWEYLHIEKVIPYQSGWDEKSFQEATSWLVTTTALLAEKERKYASKLEMVAKFIEQQKVEKDPSKKDLYKLISRTVGRNYEVFHNTRDILSDVEKKLVKISHMFEAKK